MLKDISDIKLPQSPPLDETILTGEALLKAFGNGEVTLSKKVLGGQQSSLIEISWKNKKYLIILQKNPNLSSCPDAEKLRDKLMNADFQHPHVIKFLPLTDKNTGKLILQQLLKQVNTKNFIESDVYKTLSDWNLYYKEYGKRKEEDKEAVAKQLHMESVSICELVEGISLEKMTDVEEKSSTVEALSLEKTTVVEEKSSPKELKIESDHLKQSLKLFRPIVESVLHINAIHGAHGDISGVNIIIDDKKNCTLIDIGCTIKAETDGTATGIPERDLAAPAYLAPELLTARDAASKIVVNKVDAWSLAVILVQLLTKIIRPNLFNLADGFPKDPKNYLYEKYSELLKKTQELPIDKTFLSALPESKLSDTVQTLLLKSLKIAPDQRLSIAEFLLYLDYSPEELDKLIHQNLFLAMRCGNLSMVKEFWKILSTVKDCLMSEKNSILNILDSLNYCQDIDIIAFTIQSLVDLDNFYTAISSMPSAKSIGYFFKLVNAVYYLECAKYSNKSTLKDTVIKKFITKISKSTDVFQGLAEFSSDQDTFSLRKNPLLSQTEEKLTDILIQRRGLELAIIADNYQFLSTLLPGVIVPENILNYIQYAVKYSPKYLEFLISDGFKLFSKSRQPFLHFIIENDCNVFKNFLPYIPNLSGAEINQLDSKGNSLMHLLAKKPTDAALFIFLVLSGGDLKIKNLEKRDCLYYLENPFNDVNLQSIMKFIFLISNKTTLTKSYSARLFSIFQSEEKEISIVPPQSYALYAKSLEKYLLSMITQEINLGNTKGKRCLLESTYRNDDFYKMSEIILIALQALVKLEARDDTLTDTSKCLSCLEFINSFHPQFPASPFINTIKKIYDKLVSCRPLSVHKKEAKLAFDALISRIHQKKTQEVKDYLKKAKCFSPNPVLSREGDKEYNCAPLDLIVAAIKKQESWCIGIEEPLKYSLDVEDDDNIYDWYKLTRIQCQVIYALARKAGGDTGAERGSTVRLFQYLNLSKIFYNKDLTAMCLDKDQGFYLSTTAVENKKIQELIKPGMARWEKIGADFMDYFNNSFEIKGLIAKQLAKSSNELVNLVTKLRDCVYGALVTDKNYIESFKELARTVYIPENLKSMEEYLRTFLEGIPKYIPTKEPETPSPSLNLMS